MGRVPVVPGVSGKSAAEACRWAEQAAEAGAAAVMALPADLAPAHRRRGGRALRGDRQGRAADHRLQQPVLHPGRPHAAACWPGWPRSSRSQAVKEFSQDVAPGGADQGAGAAARGDLRLRRHARRGDAAGRDGLDRRPGQRASRRSRYGSTGLCAAGEFVGRRRAIPARCCRSCAGTRTRASCRRSSWRRRRPAATAGRSGCPACRCRPRRPTRCGPPCRRRSTRPAS